MGRSVCPESLQGHVWECQQMPLGPVSTTGQQAAALSVVIALQIATMLVILLQGNKRSHPERNKAGPMILTALTLNLPKLCGRVVAYLTANPWS